MIIRRRMANADCREIDIYNAKAGDICCWDNSSNRKIFLRIDETGGNLHLKDYSPIGVVVISCDHNADRLDEIACTLISINSMRYDSPSIGGEDLNMYWGKNGSKVNNSYTAVPSLGLPTSTADPTSTDVTSKYYGYMPSTNTNGSFTLISADIPTCKYYRSTSSNFGMIPSPYSNEIYENGINDLYNTTSIGSNSLSDFLGYANTLNITASVTSLPNFMTDSIITNNSSSSYAPAACCCQRYLYNGYTIGNYSIPQLSLIGVLTTWYLPSAGELGYLTARYLEIYNAIKFIKEKTGLGSLLNISNNIYLSSTEYSGKHTWIIDMSTGMVTYRMKNVSYPVRAFLMVR